ncbi:unnamed protein product [Arctogadus glacialis]
MVDKDAIIHKGFDECYFEINVVCHTAGAFTMSSVKFESFGVKTAAEDEEEEQEALVKLRTFQKGRPTLLGAVQIVIGVIVMVKVAAMFFIDVHFQIYSTSYWGFLFFITAGSMAVSTDRRLSVAKMKGALWTNALAVLVAGGGAGLHFYVGFTYPSCHTNDVCFYLGLSEMALVALHGVELVVALLVVFFAHRALSSSP